MSARAVTAAVAAAAVISRDGVYRYSLTRRWCDTTPSLRWIMLNPSRADATSDDPTIRRCLGFARTWGYGGIVVHNLFGLRATNPAELTTHPDPVGRDNDTWLLATAESHLATVCAWGAHGHLHHRADIVLGLLRERGLTPMCLGRTHAGQPRHPLYIPANTRLEVL